MDRSERLEALIAFLRANRSATMTELARELGVSARTVRRDVAALRLRGIDIEGERGRGGGVRFARLAPLPPVRMDEGQAVGLWLSVQIARRVVGLPFSRSSTTALNQVLSALPEERRHDLRRLYGRIVVGRPASPSLARSVGEVSPTLLGVFERCFRHETCMSFQYTDRHGATTQRRIEPHGILVQVPVWYVLAIDIDKREPRTFRMDRIANPRPFNRLFSSSPIVVSEMIESGQWLSHALDATHSHRRTDLL